MLSTAATNEDKLQDNNQYEPLNDDGRAASLHLACNHLEYLASYCRVYIANYYFVHIQES